MTPSAPPDETPLACDLSQRTVRVLRRRGNGFVEFEFSIGWSELTVELMMPEPAFEAFCQENRVRRLGDTDLSSFPRKRESTDAGNAHGFPLSRE